MKKTVILLTLVLISSIGFAQKGKVSSATALKESGSLDKALETIELAVDPGNEKANKSIPWPKTWEVRGDIYQAIFQSTDENFKKLAEDPLTEALKSYKKAVELDEKGKFEKSLMIKLTFLQQDLSNQAVDAFNNEDYKLALQSFEQRLEINEISILKVDNPDLIDTVIIFNAGLAAYNAQDYEKAIKYYSDVAKYGYNEGRTYLLIASAYKLQEDTVNALSNLQEGFQIYPEDNDLLTEMISIYLQTNKRDEAMKYLNVAIEQDPGNPQFYFAQGSLFDNLGRTEDAISSYEKAIEIDETYFNSYFNLGALYFNKGVEQHEVALQVPANENEKYEEEIGKCDQWWDKALPHMEKCNELLEPQDIDDVTKRSVYETLKNLYYRMIPRDETKWKAKYDEMTSLLSNM
ncbi:MAG: tetratricopeptide repeat protein [Mariniphaga sp.]|nr:tetratricopeptide repeat protein [Mariniphaga sp.]